LIILTGDISTEALRSIANQDCIRVTKPVKPRDLARLIQELLPEAPPRPLKSVEPSKTDGPLVFVIDDDGIVRETIRGVLEDDGLEVEDYASCEAFLDAYRPGREACVLVDAYLPGMSGLALLEHPRMVDSRLPAIMITGSSDVAIAVHAMKAGASDFIEKPIGRDELLASVARALEQSRDSGKLFAWRKNAADRVASLTARQGEIMHLVLAGHPSKNIAADLGISQRTVENHRASIMKKTGAKSLPALARLALAAASIEGDQTAG
jgi:two-component system CheB/CheR fusion protein